MRKTALTLAGLAMIGSLQFLRPVTRPADQHEKPQNAPFSTPESSEPQGSAAGDEDSSAAALCKYFFTQTNKSGPHRALWFEDERQITLADKGVVSVRKAVTTGEKIDPVQCVPKEFKGGAQFLISTVPDPINSHLALEYDRSLESIERAAADAGYTFDRFWLPWNEAFTKPQADLEKTRATERERHLREEEPGILLFHSLDDGSRSPELLVVFLVGETPASGLNKRALWTAIKYIRDLQMKTETRSSSASSIKITGPNLSASLHSMAVLLRSVLKQDETNGSPLPSITITSGSVTNHAAIQELDAIRSIRFQSLANDDRLQFAPIIAELKRITGAQPCEIALISETASGYQGPAPPSPHPKDPCSEVLQLHFPRDIAPLRNAYQAAQDSLAASKSKETGRLPQVSLPMDYGEREAHERDTVPAAAQSQTPVSQDAVMQQIVQTLRQSKIKSVVISASSTLDTLFLLHYLREFTPNIRVALPGADLLYIRSGEPRDFTGTIVFSDYPLLVASTVLPGNRDHKFASTFAEDLYFAVLVTLRPDLVYEKAATPGNFPRRQFWMGVIGKTAYWPVRFPVGKQNDNLGDASPTSFKASVFTPPLPGWLWYFLLALITIAAFVHCWAVLAASKSPCYNKWWLEYYAIDHGQDDEEKKQEYRQVRGCYLLLATINIAIAQFVVVLPTFQLNVAHQTLFGWSCIVVAGLLFLFSLVVICRTARAALAKHTFNDPDREKDKLKKEHDEKVVQRNSWWVAGLCLAAFLVVLAFWAVLCFDRDGLYFSYRAAFILSGVSPALPVLLVAAGIYAYAIGSMRRVTYFQNRFATFPSCFDEVLHTDFKGLQRDLEDSLTPVAFFAASKTLLWLIGLPIVAIILWCFHAAPSSIEGWPYDFIIFAGAYAIWAALLTVAVRFWFVWRMARKMLLRLERQPVRYAFNRIPGLFSWTPIWRLGGIKRSMLLQSRSLEYLRCLGPPMASDTELKKVQDDLDKVLKQETGGQRITHEKWNHLNDVLCQMATRLVSYLVPIWKAGGADSASKDWNIRREDLPKGPGWRSDEDHRIMLAAEFIALRFVAVIRYISLQMRNLLAMMSFGFVFAVLALESYPFQPRERISWWILGAFIALGSIILVVFRGLSSDLILKRLTASSSGKFDTVFLWPILKFGALPLLTVLASQFPALSSFLFSWLEPALGAFH